MAPLISASPLGYGGPNSSSLCFVGKTLPLAGTSGNNRAKVAIKKAPARWQGEYLQRRFPCQDYILSGVVFTNFRRTAATPFAASSPAAGPCRSRGKPSHSEAVPVVQPNTAAFPGTFSATLYKKPKRPGNTICRANLPTNPRPRRQVKTPGELARGHGGAAAKMGERPAERVGDEPVHEGRVGVHWQRDRYH